jgi:hypothetical protein
VTDPDTGEVFHLPSAGDALWEGRRPDAALRPAPPAPILRVGPRPRPDGGRLRPPKAFEF